MDRSLLFCLVLLLLVGFAHALPILNASKTSNGCSGSLNYSDCYNDMVKAMKDNGNVSRLKNGVVFTPWFDSSTACGVSNLKSGASCNIGTVNFSQYCQVSDEHSQQAVLFAAGNNQTSFDGIYYFLNNSQSLSVFGSLPGWRCVNNETANNWDCRRPGVNGNGDDASDANGRYIYSLYVASNNTAFADANRTAYRALANRLVVDFVKYDLRYQCTNSTLGNGEICWWQGSGGNASNGGFSFGDFYYSGYPQDSVKALLAAYRQTNNQTYLAIANNLTLGYLQLSNWTGSSFRVPPGRSGHIVLQTVGAQANVPVAICDNTCSPDQWDSADAPRAFAWGEASYEANLSNVTLPNMSTYMSQWSTTFLSLNNNSVVYQYYANGTASSSSQSGYLAQGWQAQAVIWANQSSFEGVMRNAISHFQSGSRTMDSSACMGTYNEAFYLRALAVGMGKTEAAFGVSAASGGGAPADVCSSYYGGAILCRMGFQNCSYVANSSCTLASGNPTVVCRVGGCA